MSILIAFSGKTGTTQKCAELLQKKFNTADVANLELVQPDISKYDLIIVGSAVRIGMIHKKAKAFIKSNEDLLKQKKTAFYICCGFSSDYKKYFTENISAELLNNSLTYDTFGGELDLSKQQGFDKFVVKMVTKSQKGAGEVKNTA